MAKSVTPRPASGLRELVEHYDLFLLDQYGVLHDGEAPYPGVLEALKALRRHGKQLCVLTNSGRSSDYNILRLAQLGLDGALFDRVATSGDMALEWLLRNRPGARCFPFAPSSTAPALQAAGLPLADSPDDADVILLNSLPLPPEQMTEAAAEPVFRVGLRRGLLLVCANPDLVGPLGDKLVISPGTVAGWYKARGGEVLLFGKPEPDFFHYALSLFPDSVAARTVMIGDTPATDLAGAGTIGIDGAFVTGGIHAAAFAGAAPDQHLEIASALLDEASTQAAWVLPRLVW
jgi:HAD superfamily hydrolase (TIGR01459 family)